MRDQGYVSSPYVFW